MAKVKTAGRAKAARRQQRKKKSQIQERRKKEFTYRGYTLEQLQKMSDEQLMNLFPARVRRKMKRGYNPEEIAFLEKMKKSDGSRAVRTHRREMIIMPSFVGKKIAIYNGKDFQEITVAPEMIGHFLGEFASTRRAVKHSGPGVGATRSSKYMPLK